MPVPQHVLARTINYRYATNPAIRLFAEGNQSPQVRQLIPDPHPDPKQKNPKGIEPYNGGMVIERDIIKSFDDVLVRFAAKKDIATYGLSAAANSPWWLTKEHYHLFGYRAREYAMAWQGMVRNQLALPAEWNDCDVVVQAIPKHDLFAWGGRGKTVVAASGRYTIAPEAPHQFMDQLFIPGLGRTTPGISPQQGQINALAWLEKLSFFELPR